MSRYRIIVQKVSTIPFAPFVPSATKEVLRLETDKNLVAKIAALVDNQEEIE